MAGLILDNILVFLFRVLRMRFSEHRSRNWPIRLGIVEDRWADRGSYPSASVNYVYYVEGSRQVGTYTKPFWSSDTAYDFARSIAVPMHITVRYNPENPSESIVDATDQWT